MHEDDAITLSGVMHTPSASALHLHADTCLQPIRVQHLLQL